jgi:hypothetical protein
MTTEELRAIGLRDNDVDVIVRIIKELNKDIKSRRTKNEVAVAVNKSQHTSAAGDRER